MRAPTCQVHPTPIRSYALGLLNDTEMDVVEQTLESCEDCRRELAELSGETPSGKDAAPSEIEAGVLDAIAGFSPEKKRPANDESPLRSRSRWALPLAAGVAAIAVGLSILPTDSRREDEAARTLAESSPAETGIQLETGVTRGQDRIATDLVAAVPALAVTEPAVTDPAAGTTQVTTHETESSIPETTLTSAPRVADHATTPDPVRQDAANGSLATPASHSTSGEAVFLDSFESGDLSGWRS